MSADQVGTDTNILIFTYEDHIEMCGLLYVLENCDFEESALTPFGWKRYGALNMKYDLAEKYGIVDYSGDHPSNPERASVEVQSI